MEINNIDLQQLTHYSNIKDIPLRQIINQIPKKRAINPDIVYKSLLLNTITSDTSEVNINKYGKLNFKFKPVGEIFCDNVFIIAHTPIECVKIQDNNKLENGNKHMDNQRKEILGFLERKGVKIIAKCIKPLRITPMDGQNNLFTQPALEDTLKIYRKYAIQHKPDKSNLVAQYFQVELSQLNYKDVLEVFNPENITDLYKSYYLKVADIDFTQDYRTFCKRLLWNYLLKQGFREQRDTDKLDDPAQQQKETDEEAITDNINSNCLTQDNGTKILFKNGSSVGSNCLSYIDEDKRNKYYNKFVHALEIKNHVQQVGTNMHMWVNNKEERLNETIPKILKHGYTRLEITFYRHNKIGIPSEEEILYNLDELIKDIPEEIIYNTPIKKQWKAYTEAIKDNVLLVDLTNNAAILAYSINKQTNIISGIKHTTHKINIDKTKQEGNKTETKALELSDRLYLLTHCTMNTPIILMFVEFYNKTHTAITNKTIDGVMHEIQT
jgi:hypothetical protein